MTYNEKLDYCLQLAIQGQSDESEILLKELNVQQPDDPRVLFNLGWHDFRKGKLTAGFEKMVYGRHLNVFGSSQPSNKPIWRGEPLEGKTVLFNGEGGYGDQIINLRFGKYFYDMGAKVVVACSHQLFELFHGIDWIHQLVDVSSSSGIYCDYWIPAMHAAFVLDLNYGDLWKGPYINHIKPRSLKSDKIKIGIRWAGNPKFEHEQHRKFDPEYMFQLTQNSAAEFYSLQKDDAQTVLPDQVIDLENQLDNWTDTAEIIASLDLVITSCTAVAHLSASMGIPTWVVVPVLPYYLWAEPGNKSRWYGDHVTLYRQEQYGTWGQPFEKIQKDLEIFCQYRMLT